VATLEENGLRPVRRRRLYEEVAERLRDFIDVHQLKAGDRLMSERDLALRLGVSRTSVRQALTVLRTIGLVDMRHGDGVYLVRSPDDVIPTLAHELLAQYERLPAIMEVREALETQNARLAARRRTDADLNHMCAALAEMEVAIERGDDGAVADGRFHAAITRAAHNELLGELMDQLSEPINHTRRASLARRGRPIRSLAAHRLIAEAIGAGDEDLAARRMREHLVMVADVADVLCDATDSTQGP
jgi:GntR family transcriptional repressor for pyruvate dehydrogenase complex